MIDGMYLNLYVGPVVPAPAPREVVEALSAVTVTSSARAASGFELSFQANRTSSLHMLFLTPLLRVVVAVTVNGSPEVLVDGVVTQTQFAPGPPGQASTLSVQGRDLSILMDKVDLTGLPFPALPVAAIAALTIAKYAPLGMIPLVVPPVLVDAPSPTEKIRSQKGTDLKFLTYLGGEIGYVFYVEPGPAVGTSVAYFGPEIKVGEPQPALSADFDVSTNVESLTFRYDAEAATAYAMFVQEPKTKIPIPIPLPNISLLNPPLGAVPAPPFKVERLETGHLSPLRAALTGLAKSSQTSDAISGDGTLDVLRYGHVLKARRLVGVRGAGPAFDGLHYVVSVTHIIKRGEYKQSFSLARNALLSNVPRVPV
jgi:hypothetical protein